VEKFLLGIGILVIVLLVAVVINILQNGTGGWDGRSVEKILGVPPQQATVADIEKLSKSEVMQLFYAAPPPEFTSVNGEYKAKILQVGIMGPVAPSIQNIFSARSTGRPRLFIRSKKMPAGDITCGRSRKTDSRRSFALLK